MTSDTSNVKRPGNRWSLVMWAAAVMLWLVPLIAMQFTRDVNWTISDFAVFGVMLLVACGTYELAARMSGNNAYRAATGLAVAAAFFLIWIDLAVGMVGSGSNLANLMFAGVPAIGLIGTIIVRFKPRGMAGAMIAMAVVQGLIAMFALATGLAPVISPAVILTGVFGVLWVMAAWLFMKAARA